MALRRLRQSTQKKPCSVELLESRKLLAAFGTPWPSQRDLTISFPQDGVLAGSEANVIGSTLDAIADRKEWQELALRAYQTWAIHADINVGLRSDDNLAFGTPGFIQGDPRFGDFRIGAISQSGLMANSFPFQALAGSYSGDILINSSENYQFHSWEDSVGPDPQAIVQGERDLFSVLLHEAGNTLGIDDNLMDWSVMFRQYVSPKGLLAAEDIASLQALYGARTDPYEQSDNGQLVSSTLIPVPVGTVIDSEVVRTRGSLMSETDIDHYRIVPVPGQASVTIHLIASGVSLLNARVEITDSTGAVLAEGAAASVFDNNIELSLGGLANLSEFFVRVSPADPEDIYAVGDYFLEIDYRSIVAQAAALSPQAYDAGPGLLGVNFPLFSLESVSNDTIATATPVSPISIGSGRRFEWRSSLASVGDIDLWKIAAPTQSSGRLVVHVAGVGLEQPEIRVQIVDSEGRSVGASGRLRADGGWALEVAQPIANEEYNIRITVDPSSEVSVGNYIATAEFSTASTQMNFMSSGEVDSTVDRFIEWTAGKTKLYRFDLKTVGVSPTDSVALTIYDAHTLESKMAFISRAGTTRTAMIWLAQGEYILRFEAVSSVNHVVPMTQYLLTCDGLSDDQDNDFVDPGDDPYYNPYYYHPPVDYVPEDPDYEYPYTSNPYYYFFDPDLYYYYYYYHYYRYTG